MHVPLSPRRALCAPFRPCPPPTQTHQRTHAHIHTHRPNTVYYHRFISSGLVGGYFTNKNINVYRMMMICTSVGQPNSVGMYNAWIFIRRPLYINNVTTFVAARTIAFRMETRELFLKIGWKLFFFRFFFFLFFILHLTSGLDFAFSRVTFSSCSPWC